MPLEYSTDNYDLSIYQKTDSPKWIGDGESTGCYNGDMKKIDTAIHNLEASLPTIASNPNIITLEKAPLEEGAILSSFFKREDIKGDKISSGISGDKIGTGIKGDRFTGKFKKIQLAITTLFSGRIFKDKTLSYSKLIISGTQFSNGSIPISKVDKNVLIGITQIGLIIYIPVGDTVPDKYLLCNGADIVQDTHPILYYLIGTKRPGPCPFCPTGYKTIVKAS